MDFVVTLDADSRALSAQLAGLQHKLSDTGLEFFLEDMAHPFLVGRARARFGAEGDDAVGMWVPLDPTTEMIRRSLGYGGPHPINIRTRQMLNYIVNGYADVSAGGGGSELTFPARGAPTPIQEKIETAQIGKPWPMTPPRPVVALSGVDERVITSLLGDYITAGTMSVAI